MKTFVIRLQSNSPTCRPLVCDCGILYLNIKPTVTAPIRTSSTAPGVNLLLGTIQKIQHLTQTSCFWDYTIEYDETQLEGEDASISACDIESMCCRECVAIALEKIIDKKIADALPEEVL